MIPHRINFISFGDAQEYVDYNIETFVKHNPDYLIIIHDETSITKNLLPEYQNAWSLCENYQQQADVLRLCIIQNKAGWYFDTDCRCFDSLNKIILKSNYLACADCGYPTVDNWCLASHNDTDWTKLNNYFNDWDHKREYFAFGQRALQNTDVEPIDWHIVCGGTNAKQPGWPGVVGHNFKSVA